LALANALRTNTTLTALNLRHNLMKSEPSEVFADALTENTSLTSLDLSSNEIESIGGVALAQSLRINFGLTALDLSGNQIVSNGGMALAQALRLNKRLKIIDLNGNGIGTEGGIALAKALGMNSVVTSLGLGGNSIGPEAGVVLTRALERNTTLTTLRLNDNGIGADANFYNDTPTKTRSSTGDLMKKTNGNTKGDIFTIDDAFTAESSSFLGSWNVESLAKGRTALSSPLSVGNIGGDATIETITECQPLRSRAASTSSLMMRSPKRHSVLGNNMILQGTTSGKSRMGFCASSSFALMDLLRLNNTLTDLNLRGNNISDEFSMSLAKSLLENSVLTALNLSCNTINAKGGEVLADCLKQNTSLTELNLSLNSIGGGGPVPNALVEEAIKVPVQHRDGYCLVSCPATPREEEEEEEDYLPTNARKPAASKEERRLSQTWGGPTFTQQRKVQAWHTSSPHLSLSPTKESGFSSSHHGNWSTAAPASVPKKPEKIYRYQTGDCAGMAIVDMLKANCSLVVLNLQYNGIGKEAIRALSKASHSHPTLKNLKL